MESVLVPWLLAALACRKTEETPPAVEVPGAVTLGAPEVRGDGTFDVSWSEDAGRIEVRVTATSDGAVFRGLRATGTWDVAGDATPVLWRQGYQSWSASGVFALQQAPVDADGWPVIGGDAGGFDVLNEKPGTSWWAGLVGRSDGGSVLVGALSADVTKVGTAWDPTGGVQVVWGNRGEAVALDAGESLALDPVVMLVGDDPNDLWRDWADAAADAAGVTVREPPPVGWSTWYQYYEDVSEDDVRANLAAAQALGGDLAPIGLFQLDDGWEPAWGDWTANERFPSGTGALAADLRDAGMVPGLWLAPFYVSRSTTTWAEHPDWFVHRPDGTEVDYQGNVALDVTHPEAAAWLRGEIRRLVDEGWTYLKLDFLYAAAEEGVRHEPVTGAQAYRIGVDLLREAAGPDTWILACGAPLLPSVGFADSFRTGPDIAFTVDPDPRRPFLRNQVRSTAARGFTNGRWWWVDADALMVREPFTDDDARGSVVSMAASGGAWLLGDGFDRMAGDRLAWALDPGVVGAAVGADVRPVDPLSHVSGFDTTPLLEVAGNDDDVPTRWELDGATALLNLGDTALEVDGPGGTELLTGETAGAGARTLPPGAGEIWIGGR
ncbi:MAG: alpha-galactosidase [Alphaproteobacteria bacterium]|nr:alpha-galactosidase [Alphaproteobacteria bacterium]